MKEVIKQEIVSCEICGHPVIDHESGVCMRCEKCGWQSGGDNTVLEQQWGISYPMLVSLDFDEFVRGLLFYSEMLFDYHGETYEAYLYRDKEHEPYKFVFCCAEFRQEYDSEQEFCEKANIRGKRLKDIWNEVQDPRYM